ncbi:hypothetical protein ACQR06_24510 [Bradyrhizobium sp. HKCCYLRH1065]|uniref:hypothetical protein n=1 Tax=Bradyrhizobium sp. HKCCYLRH1065 TaxID=3420753 RepID=UPI003EB96DAA
MAKHTAGTKTPSRIRLVVLEAEIGDNGDVAQLTQAMTAALRGPAPNTVVKRIAAPTQQANGNGHIVDEPEQSDLFEAMEEEETVDVTPAPKAPRKKRVGPKPNQIPIDVDSEPKLSTLVDGKSNHRRYLAIAAWLHDHRDTPVITQDHIYSCYRLLNWPIDIADFGQPFRELKHKRYFETPEKGKYAINQLGLQKAKED